MEATKDVHMRALGRILLWAVCATGLAACAGAPRGGDTDSTASIGGSEGGSSGGTGGGSTRGEGSSGSLGSEGGESGGSSEGGASGGETTEGGTTAGGAMDPLDCPPTGVRFESLGLVHAPTVGDEYKRVSFKPPPGEYAEVRLTLEVFAPHWNDETAGMRHMLFWFARDGKHFDLFAYASLVAKTTVLLRHGIGIPAGDKPKLVSNAMLPTPETYHVAYRYDMAGGVAELEVTRAMPPVPVATLMDVPNVQSITIGDGGTLDVDLGNQGPEDPFPNPQEPPQYGWTFSDLRVCAIPK